MKLFEAKRNTLKKVDTSFIIEGKVMNDNNIHFNSHYHLIHSGTELRIGLSDQNEIQMVFRGKSLGSLYTNSQKTLIEMISRGYDLRARVTCVEKKKYLPTEKIVVELYENELN